MIRWLVHVLFPYDLLQSTMYRHTFCNFLMSHLLLYILLYWKIAVWELCQIQASPEYKITTQCYIYLEAFPCFRDLFSFNNVCDIERFCIQFNKKKKAIFKKFLPFFCIACITRQKIPSFMLIQCFVYFGYRGKRWNTVWIV